MVRWVPGRLKRLITSTYAYFNLFCQIFSVSTTDLSGLARHTPLHIFTAQVSRGRCEAEAHWPSQVAQVLIHASPLPSGNLVLGSPVAAASRTLSSDRALSLHARFPPRSVRQSGGSGHRARPSVGSSALAQAEANIDAGGATTAASAQRPLLLSEN